MRAKGTLARLGGLLALLAAPLVAAGEGDLVVLPLSVNEVRQGEVTLILEPGDARVRVADLERAGLRGLAGVRSEIGGESFVALGSLAPEVSWRFEERTVELFLTAAPELLGGVRRSLAPPPPAELELASDPSVFVNYSVTTTDGDDVQGFSELGWSVGRSLLYGSLGRGVDGELVRGTTTWSLDDADRLLRWTVGDAFAGGGGLGGSAFLAGLGVSREFELDPYFRRYPGVGVAGAVLTPSEAEIYVDGRLVRRERLAPGTFEFTDLPIAAGQGETRVVLRDAFGGERVLEAGHYLGTALLAKRLSEFSYQLGLLRESAATESFDYGSPALFAHHRVGLTERLTAGYRFEAVEGTWSGGLTAATAFRFGELEATAATSRADGRGGAAGSLAYRYRTRRFGAGGLARWADDAYATVSLAPDRDRAVRELSLYAGISSGRFGSWSLQHATQRWRDAGSSRRSTLSWSTAIFGDLSMHASASLLRELESDDETTEIAAAVHVPLGDRRSASASWRSGADGDGVNAVVHQSAPRGVGLAYRLEAESVEASSGARQNGRLTYGAEHGVLEAAATRTGDGEGWRLGASGGLVAIGGSVFATRPVQRAYALLRVPGVGGVRGYSSHQEIGETDARGDLFVPDLLPYYGNVLGIADVDLPIDYEIDRVRAVVAPPRRGGAVVEFPVRRIQGLMGEIELTAPGGALVPAYGELTVALAGEAEARRSTLGSAGDFYLENLPAGRHRASVRFRGEECGFVLEVPAAEAMMVELGRFACAVAALPGDEPIAIARREAPAPAAAHRSAPPPTRAAVVPNAAAPRFTSPDWVGRPAVHVVHFSSFRTRERARRDAERIAARLGLAGRAVEVDLGERGVWYRAVVGEFDSVEAARRFLGGLPAELASEVGGLYRLEGRS